LCCGRCVTARPCYRSRPSVIMLSRLFLAVVGVAAVPVSFSAESYQHGPITNEHSGTITHPLIPHKVHLERRRRELKLEQDSEESEFNLPPRPHTSRHSTTPASTLLRAGNDERSLQQQMGALYQGYGTHYVDLWVGSPIPQRQTVIVDTGSGVTAFPCEECKGCGDSYHTDRGYKEALSDSFLVLPCDQCLRGYCANMDGSKKCRISMSYAEGSSWTAYEARDICYAGGPHDGALTSLGAQTNVEDVTLVIIDPDEASKFAFELAFGCQISITGLFVSQLADGIMGMENENTSFWKQMLTQKAIPRPQFSLCFSRQDFVNRGGTRAGAMTLGGVDPRLHMSPMVFAKNMKSSGFYAVHLKAMYLREGGGVSARTTSDDMKRMHKLDISESSLNRGNVIVDSGTTDSYFTSALAKPFGDMWQRLTGKKYSHTGVSMTEKQIDAMPTIILVIQGYDGPAVGDEPEISANYVAEAFDGVFSPRDIVIAIPAAHYMEFDSDSKKYVARFYTEESSGSVLGANAMMGHDIFFDVAHSRVGFAESDCSYMALVLEEGGNISADPGHVSAAKTEVTPATEEEGEEEDAVAHAQGQNEVIEEIMVEAQQLEDALVEEGSSANNPESNEHDSEVPVPSPPLPPADTESSNTEAYQLFGNDSQDYNGGAGNGLSSMAADIMDDMKHECSSTSCRGVAGLSLLAASVAVFVMVRRAVARRRVVRQYQEAELEISDLALDSDSSDDEGGYVDEPTMPRMT